MTAKEVMEIRKAFRKGETVDVDLVAIGVCIDNALEKQIPKKPRITVGKYRVENSDEHLTCNFTHCPCCFENPEFKYFESLIDLGTKYCRRCGQLIDWSDEDD